MESERKGLKRSFGSGDPVVFKNTGIIGCCGRQEHQQVDWVISKGFGKG